MNQESTLSLTGFSETSKMNYRRSSKMRDFTLNLQNTIPEEQDVSDLESTITDIDSKFENSMLSFMEQKSTFL